MAIFHLSVKTVSRSTGRSATAAAAYRAGVKIVDDRTGAIHDYTRRRGVEYSDIFLPKGAPAWASQRTRLWNEAESSERRKNSVVAREIELSLPAELNHAQRIELVRDFARELVQRHGVAVDVAIHSPCGRGDERNHHAHLLCSTRRLTPDGLGEKAREWDDRRRGPAVVAHWRERWEQLVNRSLELAGEPARVDHRSLRAQRAELDARIQRLEAQAAELQQSQQSVCELWDQLGQLGQLTQPSQARELWDQLTGSHRAAQEQVMRQWVSARRERTHELDTGAGTRDRGLEP